MVIDDSKSAAEQTPHQVNGLLPSSKLTKHPKQTPIIIIPEAFHDKAIGASERQTRAVPAQRLRLMLTTIAKSVSKGTSAAWRAHVRDYH